jgi:hypothetical protein
VSEPTAEEVVEVEEVKAAKKAAKAKPQSARDKARAITLAKMAAAAK